MEGWIKLHRSIVESSLWPNEWLVMLWVWCLVKANHKDGQFMGETIKRGQFVTGKNIASGELQCSISKWFRGMKKLEDFGCLRITAKPRFTIVTICNYETYQDTDLFIETQVKPKRNRSETQVEPIEECKNERIDISKDISRASKSPSVKFIKPSLDEVAQFCMNRSNGIDPEAFIAHYESNGWRVGKNPMKDWRQAVVTWEKNKNGFSTPKRNETYRVGPGQRYREDQERTDSRT